MRSFNQTVSERARRTLPTHWETIRYSMCQLNYVRTHTIWLLLHVWGFRLQRRQLQPYPTLQKQHSHMSDTTLALACNTCMSALICTIICRSPTGGIELHAVDTSKYHCIHFPCKQTHPTMPNIPKNPPRGLGIEDNLKILGIDLPSFKTKPAL